MTMTAVNLLILFMCLAFLATQILLLLSQIGALFTPYMPHVGGQGAVFALVGVTASELVQVWPVLDHPIRELLKLCIVISVFLICGTFPSVDNFELLGGFIFGVLLGIIFLPYITFGTLNIVVRLIAVVISISLVIVLFILILYSFYYVQTIADTCSVCTSFNCIQYTPLMCKMSELW